MFFTYESFAIFILFTILFFLAIAFNAEETRCPYDGAEKCFDGNGKYQWKGRGSNDEDVETLLQRIKWLGKNSVNSQLYSTSFIVAYPILLSIIIIFYAYSQYILNVWEMIIVLFAAFIITFSILNLFSFHTDRYPSYYIRENIYLISKKLRIKLKDPPEPSDKSFVPHRTQVRDRLNG